MKPFLLFLGYFVTALHLVACSDTSTLASPPGYDLSKPEVIALPNQVNEISGIAYRAADSSVYAVDDNHGSLYKIPVEKYPQVQRWQFGKAGDYEDVLLQSDTVYVLDSHGELTYFP